MGSFSDEVYAIIKNIPKGKVQTYKQIATVIGKPNAYRAVGNTLNKNKDKNIPCRRVVKSSGGVGGFNKGIKEKIRILVSEGVEVENGKINKKYFYNFNAR